MEEMNIVDEFKESMDNSNMRDLIIQGADMSFDMFVKTGDLSAIPVFGLLDTGVKIYKDYSKYRFANKIYNFIWHIRNFSQSEIDDFMRKYTDANKENGYDVLLSVIDRIDNINKITIMANMLHHEVKGNISVEEFVRLVRALERIAYTDIRYLKNYMQPHFNPSETDSLVAAGLVRMAGVNKNGESNYELNSLGWLFLKFGLDEHVDGDPTPKFSIPTASKEDIERIINGEYHVT
jgi:hypothetical protein